jgi:hypothetical protein
MRLEHILPACSIALNLGCLAGYAWVHDWPRALYWVGAAIINVALLI